MGWSRALLGLAGGLVLLTGVAGVINRQVLDGPTFAAHADRVRQNPHVAQLIGDAITDRLIGADPDLVAVRPAVQAMAIGLVRSSAFSPIVRAAVTQAHQAFTTPGSGQVVLRLADVSAVLTAALRTLDPAVGNRLPGELDVTLATVGSQSFAARTIHLTRLVREMSWLLALLSLMSATGAVLMAARRRAALARCGLAVAAAGVGTAIGTIGMSVWVAGADTETVRGAIASASWSQLAPAFWRTALTLVIAGALIYLAVSAGLPQETVLSRMRRVASWLREPGPGRVTQVAAALLLLALGVAILLEPKLALQVGEGVVGVALLLFGLGQLIHLLNPVDPAGSTLGPEQGAYMPTDPVGRPMQWKPDRQVWRRVGPAAAGITMLVVLIAVQARPAVTHIMQRSASQLSDSPGTCNGYAELCSRRYDQVAYATTHNAMSAADEPGWYLPEQPNGLIAQLNAGIRAFLIDTWYGHHTQRNGVITTSAADHAVALRQSEQDYGPAVVASALRLRAAAQLAPAGPAQPYLCHGLCELGSTQWEPAMIKVRNWLRVHARQVITLDIEDYVSPADTADVFREAGLLPYVHVQHQGHPWPTLAELIRSGQRVVVFTEHHGGGAADPWLMPTFDWIQDTPFDNATAAALTCTRLRGTASQPLLMINNFLSRFRTRVSDSAQVNDYGTLLAYTERCHQERAMIPNFVAVDYYTQGDVIDVVNELNGVS